jgi:hypothetical protein
MLVLLVGMRKLISIVLAFTEDIEIRSSNNTCTPIEIFGKRLFVSFQLSCIMPTCDQ